MLVSFEGKNFKLSKFPPILGRKLMTKGGGIRELFQKSEEHWEPIFEHIQVNVGDNHWIPLKTRAMVENHVPASHRTDLILLQLQHNCSDIEDILYGPTLSDAIWEMLAEAIEEAFNQ